MFTEVFEIFFAIVDLAATLMKWPHQFLHSRLQGNRSFIPAQSYYAKILFWLFRIILMICTSKSLFLYFKLPYCAHFYLNGQLISPRDIQGGLKNCFKVHVGLKYPNLNGRFCSLRDISDTLEIDPVWVSEHCSCMQQLLHCLITLGCPAIRFSLRTIIGQTNELFDIRLLEIYIISLRH